VAVEDAHPHASDTDNAAAQITVCMFLSDYHKSNSEYRKTEFKFKFKSDFQFSNIV